MKKLALGSLVAGFGTLAATVVSAAPCGGPGGPSCTAVPEISALEGTAALAALAAIVLLVWERRRRAA
jgi:hypothetical protein